MIETATENPDSIDKPRRAHCRAHAMKLLRDFGCPVPPIPVYDIARSLGCDVHKGALKGPDGYTIKVILDSGKAAFAMRVAIDAGTGSPMTRERRRRWTVAHEIGHIVMHGELSWNSTKRFESISKKASAIFEREANWFADRLLMPNYAITTSVDLDPRRFSKKCDVNLDPATRRIAAIRSEIVDLIRSNDDPNQFAYGMKMTRRRADKHVAKWQEVTTDENGRMALCPHCEFEPDPVARFCPICGLHLYNACADPDPCEFLSSGFSRYCQICGGKTSLYAAGYLTEPDEYLEWKRENASNGGDPFADEPDVEIDDDLPF